MRIKTIDILKGAMKNGYAVGAFNTSNLEVTQAIIRAARESKKSAIIQMAVSTMNYAESEVIGDVVESVINNESGSSGIGYHLDHGKNFDDIVRAIDAGVDSVMIDGSQHEFKKNLEITKRVVDYAHEKGVAVQAELGRVPYVGREDMEIDWDEVMTNPEEAKKMVDETGVDAFAVGIGNAHGFFRERKEPDWERLKEIKKLIPETPLILHGASDWDREKVEKAIKGGVVCFNIDTDLRIAFMTVVCNKTSPKCDITDPRKLLSAARKAVKKKAMEKMEMFFGE